MIANVALLDTKSMVFYEAKKYSRHAEQNCIANCKNKKIIEKCVMILVKISENENVYPCNMCQHIIDKYKVKKVYTFSRTF